jgi:hypothetical protein
MTLRFLLG